MTMDHGNHIFEGRGTTLSENKTEADAAIKEIYLDRKLKKAESINETDKSYGIFMHSLAVSSYAEMVMVNHAQEILRGDVLEKAVARYTASRGFDKALMQRFAPRVEDVDIEGTGGFRVSAHIINDKVRIISKGTPEELLGRCPYILVDSKLVKVTRRIYREVNAALLDMLDRCLNVYAVAIKDITKMRETMNFRAQVNDMTLVALLGVATV